MREADYGFKPITVALAAVFLLAGCEYTKPYTDAAKATVKPLTDTVKSVLENVDIQPTQEQRPEDDLG